MIKVITDSTADLPQWAIEEYDIEVLPLSVSFGSETYLDGVELTGERFFDKLAKSKSFPTTSQISPGVFLETFQKYRDYDMVIYIGLSSELSGTFNAATFAAEEFDNVLVFDSKLATFALGFLVISFCRRIHRIKSKEIAEKYLHIAKNLLQSYFIVDTLEYLVKGGRLSRMKGMVGTVLKLKPVLTLSRGKLEPMSSERGRIKAMNVLIEKLREDFPTRKIPILGLYHALDQGGLEQLKNLIFREFEVQEIIEGEVGSVVGTHAGPGCIAMSYFKD